nr:hypothetical protein [Candidatus Freyarchaeota archaeon]
MSGNSDFVNRLKGELRSFGAISDKGIALVTMKGEILYSDLSSNIEQRLMLFKPSFPGLTIGSNITLAAENESVIVMRASEKMLMAVQTQQRVGLTLVMLSSLIKRYANEFDKYMAPEIIKPPEITPKVVTEEITPKAITEVPVKVVEKAEAAETVKEAERELAKEELEAYQKSLIYELIPPLTPENVLDKSGVWNRAARLMLRNLDQDLTIDELREGLNNAGFNISWLWVYETLHALETRGTVRIKGKREQ